MPIYEYKCDACGVETELQQKMSDPPPSVCEACGKGPMTKLMSMTSFVLKGSGWYTTDFRDKGKKAPAAPDSKAEPSSAQTSQSPAPSTTAPASTSASKSTPASPAPTTSTKSTT